jgi:dienelactone hydrolase
MALTGPLMRWLLRAALLLSPSAPALAASAATGLQPEVVFSGACDAASGSQIVHRLLSPLAAAAVERSLAATHGQLPAQPLDLTHESFTLYVPAAAPAQGYGLVVFVPPWPQARLPKEWQAVLERHGMIFVSAAGSGNEASVPARRAPLALLGACNVMQRYPVDPQRVYVAGFSGGSRVALRLALAWPDLFRGALLNAGSDPIDGAPVVAPAAPLLRQFQESSRLVYVTGEHDGGSLALDAASVASLHRFCAFDLQAQVLAGTAHELMGGTALDHALQALALHAPADAARLASCRQALEREGAGELAAVQALAAAGHHEEARRRLAAADQHLGGVLAPRSVELEAQLGAPAVAH